MTKQEFNTKVNDIVTAMNDLMQGRTLENVSMWFGQRVPNVFAYGATSEAAMERMLSENGHERKTTFMSDLSIAEWCTCAQGNVKEFMQSYKNIMRNWRDSVEFMSEFVLCVNWKSWEHYERGNNEWARFYSFLYNYTRDLMYEYYEGDEEKTAYMFDYLD